MSELIVMADNLMAEADQICNERGLYAAEYKFCYQDAYRDYKINDMITLGITNKNYEFSFVNDKYKFYY